MTEKNFKILVVEDDSELRECLVDFCVVNGYQADYAGNGAEALKLMDQHGSYGLVIVDFLMPKMHGLEFVKQAKAHWANLPIIAMSAWDTVESSFLDAGACFFLQKPFDPYILEKEIESIVREKELKSLLV
ncbi:MAG: response regulator [Nitrospirae bacterium]|nr:MAG: response regulator [Nitrospirota bacterium]